MTADPAAATVGPVPADCRVVVVADTHLETSRAGSARARSRVGNPVRGRGLPDAARRRLAAADAILHAGDLLDEGVLEELAAIAPTWAVLGNNDRTLIGVLPATRIVELGGVSIGMIHDSGPSRGRAARLRRRFPTSDVVVFGHSHAPCDEVGVDGQRLFNPGSATQRRAQPHHTLGELDLRDGRVVGHRIIDLD
ncbi:metallophosphatase family protein [Acidiferrimicrobium sp. IK]|uniref:metallophosphoesterase family protein n=1 Tax=Acidiferrimicrobium sp. IK TaxID=2871700 RepID=UPI0021CB8E5A|nr:metallophosphoesterase family protein [Acidiferrimicrobium sp. IK]MCU4185101.1 metallophosphatase family protein [Acidiferrimicrobium sp. IK]